MLLPLAKLGTDGQVTLPPAGKPLATHVAFMAAEGPPLVQVAVPLTVLPAIAVAGKPVAAAPMFAEAVTLVVAVAVLFPGTGSLVSDPAVTVIVTEPLAGAV